MERTMWGNLRALWRERQVHGLELLFDTLLLALRFLSLSYWLRQFLPPPDSPSGTLRKNVIDAYCVSQLLVLLALAAWSVGPILDTVVAGYILFEIYLNLLNIVFIGKLRAINRPPASVERSILLLFLNILDVVLAFGLLYRDWLGCSATDGVFHAVLVLGTIGYPPAEGRLVLLVALQVFLDLLLLIVVISSFVGQIGLFSRERRG